MRIFTQPNLSEKVQNIVFTPTEKLAKWEKKTIKGNQYFLLNIGHGGRRFVKKYKVETLSKDTIKLIPIFSIWDFSMLALMTLFAFLFTLSIIWDFGVGISIFFALTFVVLLLYYVLLYVSSWRTLKNRILSLKLLE